MVGASGSAHPVGYQYHHCPRPGRPNGKTGPGLGNPTMLAPMMATGKAGKVTVAGETGSNIRIGTTGPNRAGTNTVTMGGREPWNRETKNGPGAGTTRIVPVDMKVPGVHPKKETTNGGGRCTARTNQHGVAVETRRVGSHIGTNGKSMIARLFNSGFYHKLWE
jgi:hypothetical protein